MQSGKVQTPPDLTVKCDPGLEAEINKHPENLRPMWLARAEQHFRQVADLEVLRELKAYRRKYHLT